MECDYPQWQLIRSTSSEGSREISTSPAHSSGTDSEDIDFNDTTVQIPTWIVPATQTARGQLGPQDLELLHHYKTSTWRAFVIRDDPQIHTIHRDIVPQLSVSATYLQYALLSIAATHRNSLQPSKQLENQALVYRQKTFETYSKALQNITNANYESILVTGTFLLSLMPAPPASAPDDEHLEWMHALLKITEGLRILAGLRWGAGIEKLTVYPLLRRELRSLPPPPIIDSPNSLYVQAEAGALGGTPDYPNPAPTYQAIHFLPSFATLFLPPQLIVILQQITSNDVDAPLELHRPTLVPVFQALSPIFLSLYYYHLNPDFYVRIFVFTSFLMPEFLALVKAREPRALLLVSWWFALSDLVPKGWWVGSTVARGTEAMGREIRRTGDARTIEAFEGPERLVRVFAGYGKEEAAQSVFEGWEGVEWDDGPRKAEEWDAGLLVELSEDAGMDGVEEPLGPWYTRLK